MSSFVLAQPRSLLASTMPAVAVHVVLIVAAIATTQATLSGAIPDPGVISIDWPATTLVRSVATIADPRIPGAPILDTPMTADIPTDRKSVV